MKIGAVMFFTSDSMQPAALGKALGNRFGKAQPRLITVKAEHHIFHLRMLLCYASGSSFS